MSALFSSLLREVKLFICLPVAVHLCVVRLLIGILSKKDRLAAAFRK